MVCGRVWTETQYESVLVWMNLKKETEGGEKEYKGVWESETTALEVTQRGRQILKCLPKTRHNFSSGVVVNWAIQWFIHASVF